MIVMFIFASRKARLSPVEEGFHLKKTVLIVEDESKLLAFLKETMENEGFEVTACSSYSELESLVSEATHAVGFDVVILDRMLRQQDSVFAIGILKRKFSSAKILILSAINSPSEKAVTLDRGADDYLSKPFASEELIARVRALLRRAPTVFTVGNVSIDIADRAVKIGQEKVALANKEFMLLRTFLEQPGRVFTKNQLAEKVWEMKADVDTNAVEMTISNLRRKLEEQGATLKIRNSRNVGYWLEE